jgi:putative Mg2+ transporter-C (MgtC) family protein
MDLMGQTVYLEFFGQVPFYIGTGVKTLVAICLGLVIGLDREKKFKSAGVKTQVLICVGATIFTLISILNISTYDASSNVDPNRLQAQIVSGIGFLGAGAIIQGRGRVTGLTTAATIWTVAAIGIAVGSGYIASASFFTFTIMAILNLIEPIVGFLRKDIKIHLEVQGRNDSVKQIDFLLNNLDVEVVENEIFKSECSEDLINYHLYFKTGTKDLKQIMMYLRSNKSVDKFTHRKIRKMPDNKNVVFDKVG